MHLQLKNYETVDNNSQLFHYHYKKIFITDERKCILHQILSELCIHVHYLLFFNAKNLHDNLSKRVKKNEVVIQLFVFLQQYYYFPLKMALILILQKFPKTRKEVSFKTSRDSKWLSPFYSKYFAHTSFVQSSFFSINSRPRQKCNTQNKWTEKFPD